MGKNVSESSLATLTGLSRDRLAAVRGRLSQGMHWVRGKNGAVEFTPDGVEQVMELIRERVVFGEVEEQAEAAPTADFVMSFPCLSRYWVKACAAGSRDVVRVRVRDNSNLRRGMILRGCTKNADGSWTYNGRC